jgi:glycosyltransferase involved in cell wall biosynthesis
MLLAWAQFAKKHDDAYLYIHTEAFGLAQGVRIERLLEAVKAPIDRVRIVPQFEYRQGISADVVAKLYSASDVLLMTSRGEGFGIPTIESQACATPVIVSNWTAQPELCGVGWKVDGQPEWDELLSSPKRTTRAPCSLNTGRRSCLNLSRNCAPKSSRNR